MRVIAIVAGLVLCLGLVACGGGASERTSSMAVVDAFRAAGLEADAARPMTREDYGMAPLRADEGTRFLIPSLGDDSGGRVLTFDDKAGLEATKQYYERLGETSAAFYSHIFVHKNVLVQINGQLPDDKARQYAAALDGLD